MRKFLFIITALTVVFTAGCSKTDTNKTAQQQKAETKTETSNISSTDYSNLSQEQLNIELIKACRQGQTEEILALIKQGADINVSVWEINGKYHFQMPIPDGHVRAGYTTPSSETPLLSAVAAGHFDIVKELISAGADINKGNSHKETPLMFASMNGNDEIIDLLLTAGADVNAKSASYSDSTGSRSYTALYFASKNGHLQAVKTLLAAGAKVNIPKTESPLAAASGRGHLETVKVLQEAGALINTVNKANACYGNNALIEAVRGGNAQTVKALLAAKPNLEETGCDKTTPLKWAIIIKNAEIVKLLVNAGASVNAKSADGVTGTNISPLELADEIGNQEIINILKKANTKRDPTKTVALIKASEEGDITRVKELLIFDVDINQKLISTNILPFAGNCEPPSRYSMTGETALQKAAENGHSDIVRLLLAVGAKTDIKNTFGETALMLAAKRGYGKIVKELLKDGADVKLTNNCGATALTIARKNQEWETARILKKAINQREASEAANEVASNDHTNIIQVLPYNPNLREDKEIIKAASKNQLEKVKSLLADNVDPDSALNSGTTALMYASAKGYVEIIKTLLAANAFVDKTNNYGHTALMYAGTHGQIEAMKELLKAGADVNAADRPGRTALMFAVEKGQTEAVKFLLSAGADPSGVKNYAVTALQKAKKTGNTEIAEILTKAGAK